MPALERGIDFLLDRLVRKNALTKHERKSLKPTIRWTVEDKSKGGAKLPIPAWPPQ